MILFKVDDSDMYLYYTTEINGKYWFTLGGYGSYFTDDDLTLEDWLTPGYFIL